MKKMLLFVVAMFTAATLFAQADNDFEMEDGPTWTKTISDAVAAPKDVNVYAPVVITNQGDVVKTGTFTQAFEFAGKELEPIAKSAYIVKYDKNGNEVWGNALQGAATVTAITADEAGNVFVAGVFADKVIITSTDGQTAEINGIVDTVLVSGFITAYDKDGKLIANRQFVPAVDENIFYEKADPRFVINKMAVVKDKIYLTVNYKCLNKIDNVELNGKVLDFAGWGFMFVDLNGYATLQLDKDLSNAKLLADVYTSADALSGELQYEPESMKFAVDGDNVYVVWTGWGDLSMNVNNEIQNFSFKQETEVIDGEPTNKREHAFVVANTTTGQTKVFNAPVEASQGTFFTVADMQVVNGKLYIGGTYIGSLTFDNTKTSTGACDAFLAALNTSDLSVDWAETSGIDEGEANKVNEIVTAMGIEEGIASVFIDAIDMNSKEIQETYGFSYYEEYSESETFVFPVEFPISSVSVSVAGSVINSNEGTVSTLRYFADEEFVQGIETIDNSQLTIHNGAIFNLQGQRVGKAQKGVYIQNGKKVVLK